MSIRKAEWVFASIIFLSFSSCRTENKPEVPADSVPAFKKIVVIIGENQHASTVIGNITEAPYINSLAQSGAAFTSSYAIQHPSQPNYLCLFSGSNQGINDNNKPASHFTSPNLAAELASQGKTFACFSEDLPFIGCDDEVSGLYVRRHNPVANWTGTGINQVPEYYNQPFSSMPSTYSQLPDVCFVIPNLCNDGHDICPPLNSRTLQFDRWVQIHFNAYASWAVNNNSLLIVTYDEDDWSSDNRIATVFYGAHVKQGSYSNRISHYTVLRTIEDAMRLSEHSGAAATERPIDFCWE